MIFISKIARPLLFVLGIALLYILVGCTNSSKEKTEQKYDTIPLTKHWEKAIPNQSVPKGLISLKAKECGNCHQEIYKEWKESTHAVALQDPQFQAEMKKDEIYACLNCHTPLQNQQPYIVTGLLNGDYTTPVKSPNPQFDKELMQESITCASCHVRNGNVIGTSGKMNAPHKTIKDANFLSEKLCISCHNVVDKLNSVVCTFETGDEWKDSWAIKEGKNCISCHMPTKERPLVKGFGARKSHSHYFPGSGIPKFYGHEAEGLNGLQIVEGKLNASYTVGEEFSYTLLLKNEYAGHKIPTGDPERFFMVKVELLDGKGNLVHEVNYRIGEKWEWHPVVKKVSDNNLLPKEEREFPFSYKLEKKGNYILKSEVSRHRITKENAEFNGILETYPLSNIVYKEAYVFKVD